MRLVQLLATMYGDSRIQRRFFAISYMYGLNKWPNPEEGLPLFKGILHDY